MTKCHKAKEKWTFEETSHARKKNAPVRHLHPRVRTRSRKVVELAHRVRHVRETLPPVKGGEHLCEGESAALEGAALGLLGQSAALEGTALGPLGQSATLKRAALSRQGAALEGTALGVTLEKDKLDGGELHFVDWWFGKSVTWVRC